MKESSSSSPNLWVKFPPWLLAVGYRLALSAPVLWVKFACLLLLSAITARAETAIITMDGSKPGPVINPRMYGIFLEEINHGVDGGLYGELVRNRGFEDSRPPEGYTWRNNAWRNMNGFDSGFSRYEYTTNGVPFWSLIQEGAAKGNMSLQTTGGITEQSAYCLKLDVGEIVATGDARAHSGKIGVTNSRFFGIGLRAGSGSRMPGRSRKSSARSWFFALAFTLRALSAT